MTMEPLIRFAEAQEHVQELERHRRHQPDPAVLSLRHRILQIDRADPIEVKVALLAEMTFAAYLHLIWLHGGSTDDKG